MWPEERRVQRRRRPRSTVSSGDVDPPSPATTDDLVITRSIARSPRRVASAARTRCRGDRTALGGWSAALIAATRDVRACRQRVPDQRQSPEVCFCMDGRRAAGSVAAEHDAHARRRQLRQVEADTKWASSVGVERRPRRGPGQGSSWITRCPPRASTSTPAGAARRPRRSEIRGAAGSGRKSPPRSRGGARCRSTRPRRERRAGHALIWRAVLSRGRVRRCPRPSSWTPPQSPDFAAVVTCVSVIDASSV